MRAICSILSFDYLDYDVFLNIRIFYRLSGYRINLSSLHHDSTLVIVLRGKPSRIFSEYTGIIHFYDYVREYPLDMREFFPNATSIYSIGLNKFDPANLLDYYIYAYLPVFPSLWQYRSSFKRRLPHPLHISNFKPIVNDPYQKQLLTLIQSKKVLVYGGKWHTQNIKASQVSYFSANRLLSQASFCYGLMYPYQRGTSLSGRMWQAPINGCYVISEAGTNIYHAPGVIEAESFLQSYDFSREHAFLLRKSATDFWTTQTLNLADSLHLQLDFTQLAREILRSRFLLLYQHILFLWQKRIIDPLEHAKTSLIKILRFFCKN